MLLKTDKGTFKDCPKCGFLLHVAKFNRDANGPGGYMSYCKKCKRAYQRDFDARKRAARLVG